MNIQDIADFLDLVKNPSKYEALLTRLQDEQGRLAASIATVGKASELDKLRKEVEAKSESLDKAFKDKEEALTKQVEQEIRIFKTKQENLQATIERSEKAAQEAQAATKAAKDLAESFSGRDKALVAKEKQVAEQQANLNALVQEYNEKVAKLRAVMA
jgi:chromosome segregation ATPase